jgi:chromosome segregation ATPase
MSNTVIKEEVVKKSNQPQQKEKNIDSLIGEMNTFEIFKTDVENIFNSNYLKECVESLEGDKYHIECSIGTIKERISEIEHISQLEEEVNNNWSEIEDLQRFIVNCCDSIEDKEEPLSKVRDLIDNIEELNEEITEFYENLNKN